MCSFVWSLLLTALTKNTECITWANISAVEFWTLTHVTFKCMQLMKDCYILIKIITCNMLKRYLGHTWFLTCQTGCFLCGSLFFLKNLVFINNIINNIVLSKVEFYSVMWYSICNPKHIQTSQWLSMWPEAN